MHKSGRGQLCVYVSVKKRVPGESKRACWADLNAHANHKFAVVVDDDIDIYNEEEVWWAVSTRCRPDVDVDMVSHIASAIRDPSSYDETGLKRGNLNTKMLIDATRPVELPFATRITQDQATWQRMDLAEYNREYKSIKT